MQHDARVVLGVLEAVHALEQTVVPRQFQTFIIPVREVYDARRLHLFTPDVTAKLLPALKLHIAGHGGSCHR